MLYTAICVKNSHYFRTGTIRVRIFKWYNVPNFVDGKYQKLDDLSTNEFIAKKDGSLIESGFEEINEDIHEDFEAIVFTSLGGGKNYGLFSLPQVNSKGLVAFLENDFERPIWIGSFFEPIKDENLKKIGVNIPTNNPFQEGPDSNGAKDGIKKIDGDEGTIIFRQKKTFHNTDDESDLNSFNYDKVRTSNLISLDEKKFNFRHFSKYKPIDGEEEDSFSQNYKKEKKALHWQDFTIDKDDSDLERITFTIFNEENMKKNILHMNEEKVHIRVENKEDGPEKKGTKDKTIRNYDIVIDHGKLRILTDYVKDESGADVKKTQEVIIDEDKLHIDIKDDKNMKRHFSTMNVGELHSKIENRNNGETNETRINLEKTYNRIYSSSGATESHISSKLGDKLYFLDWHGNRIKVNNSEIEVKSHHGNFVKENSSGIEAQSHHGTNIKLQSADTIINSGNLKVLI